MPKSWFEKLAENTAKVAGSQYAFGIVLFAMFVWGATGPIFHFSDTWQLVINTSTTIITCLMVFLLQNSTNREGRGVQIKLDELIRAVDKARNEFISVEKKAEAELEHLSVK